MSVEKAKDILDKALQRCQEFYYKDWDVREVERLIKAVKIALNEEEK